ncbi:MAG: hypothetical protein R3208_06020 [Ketobacteraceae bacterium]|nr:hypothetical protein [Ketobacteraceae bacterium]
MSDLIHIVHLARTLFILCIAFVGAAQAHEVKDLKYGAILFEYHQSKYFEALVEYEYAEENGGIQNHGTYPELLKGGISLSYGLSQQAEDIFQRLIDQNLPESVRNRAWFYMAKMLYMKGDHKSAAEAFSEIQGAIDRKVNEERLYLNTLNHLRIDQPEQAISLIDAGGNAGKYTPFMAFNKGIALTKLGKVDSAIEALASAAQASGNKGPDKNLPDRSKMAIAYLAAQNEDFSTADRYLNQVKTTGVYSNQALLSFGWLAVNQKQYQKAIPSLTALGERSVAIPEVQEAMLLVPHIYEKLDLPGRAANGFISAYQRYEHALELIREARDSLNEKDMLELFVVNLDKVMGESDWFGTPPAVATNALSPFMLDLMSDHSFQSVLKDLRDLYAIRNNIQNWRSREHEFDTILQARSRASRSGLTVSKARDEYKKALEIRTDLKNKLASLNEKDQTRMKWLLDEAQQSLSQAEQSLAILENSGQGSFYDTGFKGRVDSVKTRLRNEAQRTDKLISRIENVLKGLVVAELDIHEQRIGYYMVQAQLAKTRILDRNLIELDPTAIHRSSDNPVVDANQPEVKDNAS